MPRENIALATVVSDSFLPGTLTMVESFRQTNPWFGGDVILIHPPLQRASLATLAVYDSDLLLRPISQPLFDRMAQIAKETGWTSGKELQFASIEALSIKEYDRLIFCDSDLLFLGSIAEIVTMDAPLIACGDGAYFRGNHRRIPDFAEVPAGEPNSIGNTFNSGMMILDPSAITAEDYDAVLGSLGPGRWKEDRTGHTDQMVLNLHFVGRHSLVPPTFNFMVSHRSLLREATGLTTSDAKVLHFTGPQKPWLPFEMFGAAGIDPDFFVAYREWRSVYGGLCHRCGLTPTGLS